LHVRLKLSGSVADNYAQVPKKVEAYSAKPDAKCAAADSSDTVSAPEFVKLAAEGPYGRIFIVDGAYSRCGDTGHFCGTGGCPVAVFSSKAGVTKKLYDDQALGWKISQDGFVLTLNVHGSKCGGFGHEHNRN
jgi:hypothetical protein